MTTPAPPHTTISANTVVALARISYRQLNYWTGSGYLGPIERSGAGRSLEYTAEHAWRTQILGATTRAGINPATVADALDDHRRVRNIGTVTVITLTDTITLTYDRAPLTV